MRWPSPSSCTALAVRPPSATRAWLWRIVEKVNDSSSADRSARGSSVRSPKSETPGRWLPARICLARYARSPRAVSHAASRSGWTSLIAGVDPADEESVTTPHDQHQVVEEGQQRCEGGRDVGPGRRLEDIAGTDLSLAIQAQAGHEGERAARRADLDGQG